MIKRVLVVSMVGLSLVGCVNNDTLSGDVYTASEAKQVQNVSYGTIVNVRPVQIQGGDDSNVIGAIGGAVLVVSWGILLVAEPGVLWLLQQALLQVA
ncbi:outer membrane lipoprotein [Escherichia coli]|uniref:Outer membrane lipoprotein n=1 Tax=Escherichia coli TaxID=562 RepID=A0A376U9E8_ECOLX|nr:outer membrane lipoprotein [Escherichia coli]